MLTEKERDVLNLALSKYRPGRSEPILIGDEKLLKPASKLMSFYRLRIEEIKGGQSSNQLHPMVRIRTSERAGK